MTHYIKHLPLYTKLRISIIKIISDEIKEFYEFLDAIDVIEQCCTHLAVTKRKYATLFKPTLINLHKIKEYEADLDAINFCRYVKCKYI